MKKRPTLGLPVFRVFRAATLLGLSAGRLPAARAATYTWTGNRAADDTPNRAYYDNWANG